MREDSTQKILRLLHKTHREVHQILMIVSKPTDFASEDYLVRRDTRHAKKETRNVKAAKKRIPISTPDQTTNQGE